MNKQYNRHSRFSRHGKFQSNRPSFTRRGANMPKKLDPRLFVKKAELMEQPSINTASTKSFSSFSISDILKHNITAKGYDKPTPIQEQAIPPILEGKDVIGIANTGTGKTAAFLVPLINKVILDRHQKVLIVTPTRELAFQISEEFAAFSGSTGLYAVLCIGGSNLGRQEERLRRNPQFVIGTPGRIKDLVKRNSLHLSKFHNIVLDEVDRMVDIGFIRDIQFLVSLLPKERQSLFFSATVTEGVKQILQQFVTNPVTVSVKQQETARNIDQDVIKVADKSKKLDILHELLDREGFDKVLVFGRTKWGVEKLTKTLVNRGVKAAAIHGNKSQNQRMRALQQFKQNQLQVLLATDVASRGLDIDDVTHVINYDEPASYEDYIHRIGRTGRANRTGKALTFVE